MLRDTRHFRHFRRLTGFEQQGLFYWVERKFAVFAVFVKNLSFLAGQRHGVPKAPFLGPDDGVRVFGPGRPPRTSAAYVAPTLCLCCFSVPDFCGSTDSNNKRPGWGGGNQITHQIEGGRTSTSTPASIPEDFMLGERMGMRFHRRLWLF